MTNRYLEKVASLTGGEKPKRNKGAIAAFAGSAGLVASGAHHDYKSLTMEKHLGKFMNSSYPIVQRVRKKAYENDRDAKAEGIRKSVSSKYYKAKHGLGKKIDRYATKANRRYVGSSVLTALGAGLILKDKLDKAQ